MSYWIRLPGDPRRHDPSVQLAVVAAKAANLAVTGKPCAIGEGKRYDEPLLRLRPGPEGVAVTYDGQPEPDWVTQARRVIATIIPQRQ